MNRLYTICKPFIVYVFVLGFAVGFFGSTSEKSLWGASLYGSSGVAVFVLIPLMLLGIYLIHKLCQHSTKRMIAQLLWLSSFALAAQTPLPWAVEGLTPPAQYWQNLYGAGYVVIQHFALWIWPFNQPDQLRIHELLLKEDSTLLSAGLFYWLMLAIVLRTAWRLRKRMALVAAGLGSSVFFLLPVSGLLPLDWAPISRWYLVLPSLGLSIAAAELLCRAAASLKAERRLRVLTIASLLVVVSAWSVAKIGYSVYHAFNGVDPLQTAIERDPANYALLTELARKEVRAGNLRQAEIILSGQGQYPGVIWSAPFYKEAKLVQAEALWRQGEKEAALELLKDLTADDYSRAEAVLSKIQSR